MEGNLMSTINQVARGTRRLTQGVLIVADMIQQTTKININLAVLSTYSNDDMTSYSLMAVEQRQLKEAKLRAYSFFVELPVKMLSNIGIQQNEVDFEVLYHLNVTKYKGMNREQLSKYLW